jgi:Ammonium Transporter Family
VGPLGAAAIGVLTALGCYCAVILKPKFKYDDSLDAFGVHGVGGILGALLTGVFASAPFYLAGGGSDSQILTLTQSGRVAQVFVQLLAAGVAATFAFAMTVVLIKGIDTMFGFCLEPRSEIEGLDRAQHGEVGFDTNSVLEMVLEHRWSGPGAADVGTDGKRFTVVLEGADPRKLSKTWSGLCKVGATPPSPAFLAVYPYLTTVQGNRFHFRGGNPGQISDNLQALLRESAKAPALTARVEE